MASTLKRDAILDRLENEVFDLAIIGGGITGAGIAYEASLRGLKVALLEGHDFASGTSSRSSKLIHGGLRYLERGEIALVRKTALERKEIFRLAPHLAEPRWMVMPIAKRATYYYLKTAVATYERLGSVERHERHRTWKGESLRENEPALDQTRFPFALAYREYLTDDARLVLANLRAAQREDKGNGTDKLGACILNHCPVTQICTSPEGQANGLRAQCRLSEREIHVQAKFIVNAAGPWVEQLQRLEDPSTSPILHLSKGIHITVPAQKLPVQNLMVLNAKDKRRIFALRRDDCVYLGTTDTTHPGEAEVWPSVTREDVDYLLDAVPAYFQADRPKVQDVVGAWAGLRPLIADPNKPNPEELSRRDEFLIGPSGMLSVAGGKLTGYRAMAHSVLSLLEKQGLQLPQSSPDPANEAPLPGGDFSDDLNSMAQRLRAQASPESPYSEKDCQRLVRLYGSESADVLAMGSQKIDPQYPAFWGEVHWAIQKEAAANLEDMLYRRMRLPFFESRSDRLFGPIANKMAELLDWTPQQTEGEVQQLHQRYHADLAFASNDHSADS